MKPLLSALLLPLLLLGSALPHPAWGLFQLVTKENHPELHWRTLSTEHFRIHYHQGLEQTARDCADVAEQVYGPVTAQLGVTPHGRTELGITDSDQIVNGFTFRNQIGIWVHQNEYVRQFSQPREWLRQVIAHEFQHAVTFQALHDWRGQLGLALSGTPAWWMEGLAEYYTENWNVLRSDKALRAETLDERLSQSEAHDGGYARVLYLAWRDGDSTLVKICSWRHPVLKTYNFEKAFLAGTGQTPEAFEKEWRRTLNGLYNAELAAHEPLDEIGQRLQLPLIRVRWLALLPDSSAWLVVGRDSLSRGDNALYRVSCDSTQRVERLADGFLAGQAALAEDGSRVVFDRWSWDRHGSNETDLWELELRTRRERRLTRDQRAYDPALAPDGALAYVASEGGRNRLMLCEPGGEPRVLWDPGADWQLFHPSFSPDGQRVAVASDDPTSRKGISLLERADGRATALELRFEDERDPVWVRDSLLVTTVFEDRRANLLARGLDGSCARISDSGEGLWSVTRMPQSQGGGLIALALDSAHVSRPLLVDPARRTEPGTLRLQPRYTAWRDQLPVIRCAEWQRDQHAVIQSDTRYHALELRPRATLALPLPTGFFAMSMLTDPLLHNQLTVAGGMFDRDQPTVLVSLSNFSLAWSLTVAAGWQAGYDLTLRDNELRTVRGSFLSANTYRRLRLVSRPYSEMIVSFEARLQDSKWLGREESVPTAFALRDSRSGSLATTVTWHESPPERESFMWPRWAHGLRLHGAALRPWIYGEEDVDSWSAQAYCVQPLPLPNLKGVLSARLDGLSGRRETWRSLGFGQDPLLNQLELSGLSGGVLGLPLGPVATLRALQREVAGDRVFQATAELRLTLGTPKLFRVLGVENARVNLAPFADVGQVADRQRLAPGEEALWLWTSGVEAQVGLKSEGLTLLSLGLGVGSEDLDWLRSSHTRHSYWRIHLSRPF